MCMMARTMVDKKEEEGTRKNTRDRQLSMMGAVNRLLEVSAPISYPFFTIAEAYDLFACILLCVFIS